MTSIDRRSALVTAAGAGAAVTLGAGVAAADPADRRHRNRWSKERPLRVDIVVFDGVEELDLFGPLEVFGLAAAIGQPIAVRLVTSGLPGTAKLSFGTEMTVPGAWDARSADVIVVPGGAFRRKDKPGIWTEIEKGVLTRELRRAVRPSLTLMGVCTGVVVLHAAGVIGDRPCTTHEGAKKYLRDAGADVRDARVVDDGNLVCAGGISSGIDGALWLVERELGPQAAVTVESVMEFDRRGTVLRT
ncbi:DJ-1/PfpI family protein [Streptomyces amakusaensis]|uniref:DJ-1/PfpI family protein n=1 Tax=Streptomyces amakusaensis TaxID=67271 RepID=A0ABW0AE15_9ACTN